MRRVMLAAAMCTASLASIGSSQAQQARILCTLDVRERDSLRLRSGPGSQHREVGRIPAGACGITVDERSCVGRWCIIAHDGRSGWANTHFLGIYAAETTPAPAKTR